MRRWQRNSFKTKLRSGSPRRRAGSSSLHIGVCGFGSLREAVWPLCPPQPFVQRKHGAAKRHVAAGTT